jgi:hypothetical protein
VSDKISPSTVHFKHLVAGRPRKTRIYSATEKTIFRPHLDQGFAEAMIPTADRDG